MSLKVAVMAGTPVDTQMGVDYLKNKAKETGTDSIETFYCPVSSSCAEQIKFQYKSQTEKKEALERIFNEAEEKGISDFFIYCNSLSGAFDFDSFAAERKVRVYTPLHIYAELGKAYERCVGVLAANNLSAHKIEDVIMRTNPDIYVIGTGNMQLVSAIEEEREPAEIIESLGINDLLRFYEKIGCECLILGCTHFPYLKEELNKHSSLHIVDPADEMFEKLVHNGINI